MTTTTPGVAPTFAVTAFDGTRAGPPDPSATLDIATPEALQRMLSAPGELGLGRALVSGDLRIEGDLYAVLGLREVIEVDEVLRRWPLLLRLARAAGLGAPPWRFPPPPPEEARLRGRRHSRGRDADAISHHYDVGNDFYRLFLGPTMTYSCAVWDSPEAGLDAAQETKHAHVAGKLDLQPGQRLLDVGCGWGSMLISAARHHGVHGVGVTISAEQAELARRRVAEAGVADRVEIRLADYREVDDGPYDAISSIGMFEHVGEDHLDEYFGRLHALLRPGGRLLNHGITRPHRPEQRRLLPGRPSFIQRYVFPDGELSEVGAVVSALQRADLEARHVESLREHYALTLRAWVRNLQSDRERAVRLVGPGRARVWELYMAGCALAFESGEVSVHQTLAVRPEAGRSGLPLRPVYGSLPAGAARRSGLSLVAPAAVAEEAAG